MQDNETYPDGAFDFYEWIKEEDRRHDEFILNLVQTIMEITQRKLKNREDD